MAVSHKVTLKSGAVNGPINATHALIGKVAQPFNVSFMTHWRLSLAAVPTGGRGACVILPAAQTFVISLTNESSDGLYEGQQSTR